MTDPRLPAAYNLIALDSVGSTMDEARRLALLGEDETPDGTLIWAKEQTAGRGRRGKGWESPRGNFYMSLIVRPEIPPARAAELGFVTGCAVYDTVGELCEPGIDCRLKWPNDVLLDDAKIAGILLEASGAPEVDYVIIGLGVNLRSHPADTPYPTTDFATEGQVIPDVTFLEAFARHFMDCAGRWVEEGFAPIREQWKWRARGIGKEIGVNTPTGRLHGIFRDIAEDGSLMLDTDGTVQRIAAGEIYFGTETGG